MPFYIHVCQISSEYFLLFSKQEIDGSLPEIKACITTDTYDIPLDLDTHPISIVSYGIARKEIQELLAFIQQKPESTDKTTQLFEKNKLDKKKSFVIYSYSSRKNIEEILSKLNITIPASDLFIIHHVKKDEEHILDHKYKIFWQEHTPLLNRPHKDLSKWTPLETKESELLNKLNIINLILTELFISQTQDKKNKLPDSLLTNFKMCAEQISNYNIQIKDLESQVISGTGSKQELHHTIQDYLDNLDDFTTDLLNAIRKHPVLSKHTLMGPDYLGELGSPRNRPKLSV